MNARKTYHAGNLTTWRPLCGSGRHGIKTEIVSAAEWRTLPDDQKCKHCLAVIRARKPKAATLAEWNGGELTYLAALVRTGGDSPRVPADAVDSYLAVQHAGARRDRQPDVCECITLLMMVRAYVTSPTMPTDDAVVSDLWRAFWDRVGVQS